MSNIIREGVPKNGPEWWAEEIPVIMTRNDMLCIIGNIILALRHPENKGPSVVYTRNIARRMAERLIEDGIILPPDVKREWKKELEVDNG